MADDGLLSEMYLTDLVVRLEQQYTLTVHFDAFISKSNLTKTKIKEKSSRHRKWMDVFFM